MLFLSLKFLEMTFTEMIDKINIAPRLEFGDIFSNAFDLFQKVWLQGLLMSVIYLAILMGFYAVLMIPMMASTFIFESQIDNPSDVGAMIYLGFIFLLYLIMALLGFIAVVGLQAAFFRIVRLKDRGASQEKGVNFGMFFKKRHLKKLLIFSLAYAGIYIVSYIFLIIPLLYTIIPLQFAVIIFAFHPEWSINDIFKTAFKLGNKKWGIAFALVLVSGVIAVTVGFIACFIGIYATMSFIFLPSYLIYKEVVGFSEIEDAIAQIGA